MPWRCCLGENDLMVKLLTGLPAVGTNALLLTGLVIVFKAWRQDSKDANDTLKGMVTRYEALLVENAKVLTSLEGKLE